MQVTEHVHAVRVPFQVLTPGGPLDRFVVVYLLVGGEALWLIDAGVARAEAIIADYLRAIGRDIGEINALVLTHSHPDHVGAAKSLHRASGCTVLAHPLERNWIEDVSLQARERPVPGFEQLVGGSAPVHLLVEHGDCLEVDEGLTLDIIHTPGHSRGSVSLFLRQEGALFTGDAVPLEGDLPIFDDLSASVSSIRRLQQVPDVKVLLAAWDMPQWGSDAKTRMDEALRYLKRIQTAVCSASEGTASDPLALCRYVLAEIGLPLETANPLIARSFQSIR